MPGTILSINVAVGDAVKKGQVLLVLEAMKMENEIVSPVDGTVASVNTSKGSSVNAGDLLVSLN
jgi:biotin carboxyl carrier protein